MSSTIATHFDCIFLSVDSHGSITLGDLWVGMTVDAAHSTVNKPAEVAKLKRQLAWAAFFTTFCFLPLIVCVWITQRAEQLLDAILMECPEKLDEFLYPDGRLLQSERAQYQHEHMSRFGV
jgi:hypothetical protein